MKKTWRFYLAQTIGKLALFGMKILSRRGSFLPGSIVLRIDPQYMAHVGKPQNTVVITGTNGKTTVSNMTRDYLEKNGKTVLNNSYGSNTKEGIAALFLSASSFTGKIMEEYGVIELDERSSVRVFPMLTPDIMLVTNLFRDSYARNAHTDYIFNLLDGVIPSSTKMILNSDDPVSNRLVIDNTREYYGIPLLDGEEEERDSRIKDLVNCPNCHHKLRINFIRYNHIGRYHCSNCDYTSPDAKYQVLDANLRARTAVISNGAKEAEFNLATSNIVDLYNLLSAVSILQELGMPLEQIAKTSREVSVVKTRFDDQVVNDKRLLVIMAKDSNPIASSRTFDYIRREPGDKTIIIQNGIEKSGRKNVENMGWIYDNEFTYLLDPSIKQIICCGSRYLDFAYCLQLAGISNEKISMVKEYEDIADNIKYQEIDTIALLRSTKNDEITDSIKQDILNRLEQA